MFSHVGDIESSKSVIKVLASEFRALIIILRSTGPVISTCLSRRSLGIDATFQSDSLINFVSSKKSGNAPLSRSNCFLSLS